MTTKQGNPALINDPIAQELLNSTHLAKLAYVWKDGTPRVIPIWFHWDGKDLVFGTPPSAPKNQAIKTGDKVAIVIDRDTNPYRVLTIRGTAQVSDVQGVVPEYALAAERYWGEEGGKGWVKQVGGLFPNMTRIAVKPEWVGILDFEKRFPNAIEAAMEAKG